MSKKQARLSALSLAALGLVLPGALEFGPLHLLAPLENRLLDAFQRSAAGGLPPDPQIVLVDIDDASLARMQTRAGRWPWPREIHAELVQKLLAHKPRAIVFDILFSEGDIHGKESDRKFREAVRGAQNVYFPMVLEERKGFNPVPLADLESVLALRAAPGADRQARAALLLPEVLDDEHWKRAGLINLDDSDADRVARRYWVAKEVRGWRIPSLPARVAESLGAPLPELASIRLHYRGESGAFRHVSYVDALESSTAETLRGRIVIIGASATAMSDLRATPMSPTHPGMEILATALDNLKNARWMREAPDAWAPLLALALLAAVWFSFRRRRNAFEIGIGMMVATALLLGGSRLAMGERLVLPVLAPLIFAWALYLFGATLEYVRERRTRLAAVAMFSRFLNANVVRQIVEQGETIESLSGKTREVTLLFSDIRGFTTLSESTSPQEVVDLLNRYFSRQVGVVFRNHGTLDKFIGDCIMAMWGAPLDDPRHARHAVETALEMERVLLDFRAQLGERGKAFDVGIGIHSGPAVVGFIGAEQKLEYTAIGDTVNTASRIEGLTKEAGCRIAISREAMEACTRSTDPAALPFDFVPRGSYKAKGRAKPIELFEPRRKSS
jgi:adenylate cyclase